MPLGWGSRGARGGRLVGDTLRHAWTIARSRFPEDRVDHVENGDSPLWMAPFHRYRTLCPYLVGTYDTIAREIGRYRSLGYETFILDVPSDPEELEHINVAFGHAMNSRQSAVADGLTPSLQLPTVQASAQP